MIEGSSHIDLVAWESEVPRKVTQTMVVSKNFVGKVWLVLSS
jgi:hypothetical protein